VLLSRFRGHRHFDAVQPPGGHLKARKSQPSVLKRKPLDVADEGPLDSHTTWIKIWGAFQGYRAANALHARHSNRLDLASPDTDLQRLIATWGLLPEGIRAAVIALIAYSNAKQ
jgi:hypothetical protein